MGDNIISTCNQLPKLVPEQTDYKLIPLYCFPDRFKMISL